MNKILIYYLFITIMHNGFVYCASNQQQNKINSNQEQCLHQLEQQKFEIDSKIQTETLEFGIIHSTILEKGQQKRFKFTVNTTTPLFITLSQLPKDIIRKLYLNQTVNLTKRLKSRKVFFPCATNGHYDLILQSKRKTLEIQIEILDKHPSVNWTLLNRTNSIKIYSQNRIRKKQMILNWSQTQLDTYAIQYCLVINTKQSYKTFCQAIHDTFHSNATNLAIKENCYHNSFYDGNFWLKQRDRAKKIYPEITTISCTGFKTKAILKNVSPNRQYFVDLFAIHTKMKNLAFLLVSTTIWFKKTQPYQLNTDSMVIGKFSEATAVAAFNYEIPRDLSNTNNLNILILPCDGSTITARILKHRQKIQIIDDIYRSTYISQSNVRPGERYTINLSPSTEDEIHIAKRVGIVTTTNKYLRDFPMMPSNTSVFEVRAVRSCRSTTILWYPTPEKRQFKYCVIVFHSPNYSIDNTDYCLDFGPKVIRHPQYFTRKCFDPRQKEELEYFRVTNLSPGKSYLIYVTVNLNSGGKFLPYQSIKIIMSRYCYDTIINPSSTIQNTSGTFKAY